MKFQCDDKCQCCTNKIEIYQKKLEKFMVKEKEELFINKKNPFFLKRTIVASTRIMCDHVPGRDIVRSRKIIQKFK